MLLLHIAARLINNNIVTVVVQLIGRTIQCLGEEGWGFFVASHDHLC